MKKLERVLGASLVLQILSYLMGLQLTYTSSHNGPSTVDFSSFAPFIFFVVIGLINIFLLIIYIIQIRKMNKRLNIILLSLVVINVILFLGYNYFVQAITTLPGSDLPGY